MGLHVLPKDDYSAHKTVQIWVITFFILAFGLHVWRIFSLNATYDQGLFLQEIWNGLDGKPFESTLASELSAPVLFDNALPQLGYRHLAQHFTPLLIVWVPLVGLLGIWSLPVIQVALIGLAGWILFLLAREYLSPKLSGWIACSFFTTAPVIGPSLENFHDICLVPLLFFSLLLGISKNNKLLYAVPAILLPLVREDVGLISFGIGLWMLIRLPNWRLMGLGLCLYSFVYVVVVTNWAMPLFGSEISRRFMQERFRQYLQGKDSGTLDVLIAMASQPFLLIKEIISPPLSTFRFLLTFGLPLAFIPLISIDSWLLVALPLFVALSSRGGNAMSVSLRFTLYLVPGFFSGAILWWRCNRSLFYKRAFKSFWRFSLIIACLFTISGNPHRSLSALIPDSVDPWVYVSFNQSWVRGIGARKIIKSIPSNSSVASETQLIPQLAQRRVLLRFPENYKYIDLEGNIKKVDYIVSQLRYNSTYAPAFRREAQWVISSANRLEELVAKNEYQVMSCDENGIVLTSIGNQKSDLTKCFNQEIKYARNAIRNTKYRKLLD